MRHRLVLHGVCSLVLLTSIASAQATWTGAASNSWDNALNWSTAQVPTASTDVVIAPAANQPSSFIFDPSCGSLTIQSGAALDLVAGFDLTVGGDLLIEGGGAFSVLSSTSDVAVAGGWTNDGSFSNGGCFVELTGTGGLAGASTSVFQDLAISGGVRSTSVDFTVDGDVNVESGATLTLGADANVQGNWSSGAAGATTNGTGTVRLAGTGLLTTGINPLPNLEIASGVRSVNPSAVSGDLELSGGTLQLLDNATLLVGGNAQLDAGTLSFQSAFAGNEILDIGGDAVVSCSAGAFSDSVRILCAGDWTSGASFVPTAGSVELDGVGTHTLSGTGLALHNLRITNGTVDVVSPLAIGGTLLVDTGATLSCSAVMSIDGDVVLGASGALALGGLEHTVTGNWTSGGMPATGGTIRFTSEGSIVAGGAAIENVIVDGGPRSSGNLYVPGALTLTSGDLTIRDANGILVGGDAHLDGGTLSFEDLTAAPEVLDVDGSVFAQGTLAGSLGSTAQIHCGGDWTSNDTFVPTAGTVRFTGVGSASVLGTAARFHRVRVMEGARTFALPTTLTGDFAIDDGASAITGASLSVAGFASLGGAGATWDLGGLSNSVGGDLLGAGGSIVNGSLVFDGAGGAISLGGGSLDSLVLLSGTRTLGEGTFGALTISGGDVSVDPSATVTVTGALVADGGTLGLGANATLRSNGSAAFSGVTAGTLEASSRIEFTGAWSGSPSWAPLAGATAYTGAAGGAIGGTPSFFNLVIESGDVTTSGPIAVAGDLTLGASLIANAAVVVGEDVGMTATGAWDLGGLTHEVAGDFVSLGGSATNGTVDFTAGGELRLGPGTLDAMTVSGGVRLAKSGTIAGDLSVVGGTLRIDQNQSLTVQGNAALTGGQLGWFPDATGAEEALIVEGDVSCDVPVEFEAAGSRLYCRGNWTSGASFAPTAAAVVLDGAAPTTVGGTPSLFIVVCANSTRSLLAPTAVRGNLLVQSGAGIDASGGALDVDLDATFLAGATLHLGALTHTIGGDLLVPGATVSGTGTLELDGDGTLDTGVSTPLPNALVSAGVRTANTSVIAGTLAMTGGELVIANDAVLTVQGLAQLTGGTLSFSDSGGTFETLDAASVELGATAGTMNANSLILCSGDWSSTSAWTPSAGAVFLDGGGAGTVSGGSPTFRDLVVFDGDKTIGTATQIEGNLTVFGPESLTAQAPLTVLGDVTLLSGSTFHSGQLTHVVSGNWTSTGATVDNSAFLEFDGDGALVTGASKVPNVRVVAGTRTAATSTIRFNLELLGGTLAIGDNQTLTVEQDALLSAGTLAFVGGTAGAETLEVLGDVLDLSAASGATSGDSLIVARGDWSSTAGWSPSSGLVRLAPATLSSVGGAPVFADLEVASGTAVVTTPAVIGGLLSVASGAVLETQAALDVQSGVALGDATSAWDVGAVTHDVAGNWSSSGGSATGAGEIRFSGPGTIQTGGGLLPSVVNAAGLRDVLAAEVDGDLTVEGGALRLADDSTTHVTGDFAMTGGTLAFAAGNPGPETLDVDGDVSIAGGTAGATSADALIRCAGDWSSDAGFAPNAGTVELVGAGAANVGGVGLDLARLVVASGTRTVIDAATLDALELANGAGLVASAALDVNGPMTVGDATATLDLGGLTHNVQGSYVSSGANADNGKLRFDGTGTLDTGAATIANVQVTAGTRTAETSAIAGDLELNGGTLSIANDATLSVAGGANLLGGSIAWPAAVDGTPDVLDVAGSIIARANVATASADTRLRCAGDWTSNSLFQMPAGTVALDGAGETALAGLAPDEELHFARLELSNGVRAVAGDISLFASVIQIDAGAELGVTDARAEYGSGLMTIDGTLRVGAGGRLELGGSVVALVTTGGTLALEGDPADAAVLGGLAGGGYLMSVDGTLSAANFRVERPGPGGLVVTQTAPSVSMQGGSFAAPSPSVGSILLDIRRPSPTSFYYVDFEDPSAVGTFNVRTLGGSPLTFVDSAGDFAGAAFESDPLGLIAWTSMPTTVDEFTATPDADIVQLEWSTSSEVQTDAWVLQRSTSAGGTYTDVFTVAASGPGPYGFDDTSVTPAQTYFYRLQERKTHGELVLQGSLDATPWGSSLPGNVLSVGPSGAYPDVQSALAAVSGANPVLRLAAGTYPAFTVDGGLGRLRLYADGSGPVVIDTSLAPLVIQNLGLTDSVEISDLEIGSPTSANEAVVINACAGLVVLDETTVHGGVGQAGVHATASTRVALQRCSIDGAPGFAADTASLAIVGRGSLDAVDASGGSNVRLAQVSPTVTVDGTSVVTTLSGVHANLDAPEFASLGGTWDLAYDGEPGGVFVTAFSANLAWFDLPAPFEMVGLINIAAAPQLATGVLSGTPTLQTLPMPADGVLFGAAIPLQMVVVNTTTFTFRWSNVASVVLID